MYAKVGKLSGETGVNPLTSDATGALRVTLGDAEYADLVEAGCVFAAANQGLVSCSAALSTTWTGLGVANPATSSKKLVMLEFGAVQGAAGAAGGIGLMIATPGDMAMVAASAPVNQLVGSGIASVAVVDNGATPGTPVLHRVYGSIGSVATTGYGLVNGLVVALKGSLIVPPGYAVLTYATGALTSAMLFHFLWAEVAN